MNTRDLEYIIAVSELNSFTKAAKACHVSQPALSEQIRKLEAHIGADIFERTNKRVITTEPGHKVIQKAKSILGLIRDIEDIGKNAKDPFSGPLKIGAFPTLASYIFPHIIPNIQKTLPKIKLILSEEKTDKLVTQLENGLIDAALLALPTQSQQLESIHLFDDEFFLAVPKNHDLSKEAFISTHTLKDYTLMLLDEGHCLRDQALDVCHMHTSGEDQDFRATSLETLRNMVKAGSGITLIPKLALSKKDSQIDYIPFKHPAPFRRIGLFFRKSSVKKTLFTKLAHVITAKSNDFL